MNLYVTLNLLVLAARPSMGKTAFALNIAENVAVHEGLPVLSGDRLDAHVGSCPP